MRLVLDGTKQNLYTLMTGIDSRFPHINVRELQYWFADQNIELGNANATCKIGGNGISGANNVGVDDVLTEGDRKYLVSNAEDISLKNRWVLGSANNTILFVETDPR